MFCSKCGAAVSADSAFCTNCGNPMARPAIAPPAAGQVVVPPNVGVAGYSGYSASGHQYAYGGFWLRFVAYLIDSLLMGVVIVAIFIPLAALTGAGAQFHSLDDLGRNGRPDPALIAAFISVILTFAFAALLVTWLYHAYFESSNWQATVGKRAMNVYVTDLNGNRISFLQATGRHFAKIVTGLLPFGIGYIMVAFTERSQALHDMIASTLVLRR